ncbi:dihydrolipoamide acetyltransferase family protein [Saccharopolyspora phatthalungensis]|uniref:Dihydrolipoamide acetyltransferase component of pyruvate dehydrogenase complex n=1 Tax=Saccharopolyspora phatthalungensis TaxID=664693 RepID=A0A840QB42_9PSEU|nr:dihydrolipoamide acetyltransferase family protein [Saccharopolyspora phatthalungensis]MBB5157167.1 pyruvate dehydrogenase E2 component (dihydrolipoamide acetyltransferase) [Saccharopolyspora phatthalungensis]
MATLLRMPEVAAGATEAVLLEWLVKENAPFNTGDPIAVVETDKASVEVAAETGGVILRTLVPGGTSVEVGAPMALLGADGDDAADVDRLLVELGVGVTPTPKSAPERREIPESATETTRQPTRPSEDEPRRVFISPLARKLLKEAGLTPEQLQGTGPNGRIIRRDVDKAIAEAQAAVQPTPARRSEQPIGASFKEIPHSRLRRVIAERLTASKQTIPHFYLKRRAQVDELLALRTKLNQVSPSKISVNDLILRAVAVAHQEVPEANVIWTQDALHQYQAVDIGVAIAGERGLVTPVLRNVEKTSPSGIAAQVRAFVEQANEGRLRQSDLEGGSISVTNLGMYGVEEFSAIINPPHSAILAVGAAVPEAVAAGESVNVATRLSLVLSVDHRAIDGALAARWMAALVQALEEPMRLLA